MSSSNGRILKNTLLLYFRLIFLTVINLYAVRVTLDALGLIDYGVYNVIASVVASLSILTGAMTSASQRFLSFHLGKEDYEKFSHTFTLLLMSFAVIAIVLVIIGEILGYFFVEKWLNIPPDRVSASYWVYQASIIAFALGLITIPYTSSIIANERMDAFAIFSIVEGVLKLGIAYMLLIYDGDRLILYGVLTAGVSLVVLLMSIQYCHTKFHYCKYIWKWNRSIFTDISAYTGWNLFGSVSGMLATQGQNILLNIFFGPIINAAKAIADKIQNVIYGFSINLYMAVSPQIIKSYASEEYSRAINLSVRTSKLSFLLTFILSFPVICNMRALLQIWLGSDSNTPDTVAFSKLILVYCMILSLEPPISRLIQATGQIKRYQLSVGVITLAYIPIATVLLMSGGSAIMTLVTLIVIMALAQIVRIVVAHRQVGLNYAEYIKAVIIPIIKVVIIGTAVFMVFEGYSPEPGILNVILQTLLAAIAGIFIAYVFGLQKTDRGMLSDLIKKVIKR